MPQSENAIQKCPTCAGGGLIAVGRHVQQCPYCAGAGVVPMNEGLPVPFWYNFNLTVNLPGSTSGTTTKQISNEADFQWVFTMADSAPSTNGLQCLLEDLSSNFKFSSDPVDIANFAGTGQLPLPILEPYTFGKGTQLRITVNDNNSGLSAPVKVQIAMFGFLLVKHQGVGSQSPPVAGKVGAAA